MLRVRRLEFQFVVRQPLDPSDIARGTSGCRPDPAGTWKSGSSPVDEIGYKFICPFKRDIVLLLDKANISHPGARYEDVPCYSSERERERERERGAWALSLSLSLSLGVDEERTKYDVIKRQRVANVSSK